MISCSRAGSRREPARRLRISRRKSKSGIFPSHDAVDGADERVPAAARPIEELLAVGREPVEAPPPLPSLLDPAPLEDAPLLELVEERVERGRVVAHDARGARGDELGDLVPVARPVLDEREDQQLGAALLEL